MPGVATSERLRVAELRGLGLRAKRVFVDEECGLVRVVCYVTTEQEARHARLGRNDDDRTVVVEDAPGWPVN